MNTKILLILAIIIASPLLTIAQSISFFGHHLSNISEFSNDNLNNLGFYSNDDGFYYGGLWGYDTRLYISYNSNKSSIDELIFTIPFRETEYIDMSNANNLLASFTEKISKQLNTSKVAYNVPTVGCLFGNIVYCDDGYILLYHDYSSLSRKGPIILRYKLMQ